MNTLTTGLDEVQHASTWTLVSSVLTVVAVIVAISLVVSAGIYLTMVLDSRMGGRR